VSIRDWFRRRHEPRPQEPVYPEPPSFAWWVGADLVQREQGALYCTRGHVREAVRCYHKPLSRGLRLWQSRQTNCTNTTREVK
jgi:hypothetical protein